MRISILSLYGLLFLGCLNAQNNKPLFPEMPGMVSYTYRNSFEKNVAATLDTLKEMGIKDMEFSDLFGVTAQKLRKLLDDRGMYCSSFGTDYELLVSNPHEVGKTAQILGAEFVRVASIPHNGQFTFEVAQQAVDDFNKAGKILWERYGISFCYHNHGYEFYPYESGTLYDFLVQKTDPKYVSFEMDILWVYFPGQDPVELINRYPARFKLMHLKDLRKGVVGNLSGGTEEDNDVTLGTGQLDIPSILVAAKEAGIKHYYIEDESPVYYLQVPKTIAYLKSLKY